MQNYGVDFIVFDVEDVLVVDVGVVDEDQFDSLLLGHITLGVIELGGDPLPVRMLHENHHQQVGLLVELLQQLLLRHESYFLHLLLHLPVRVRQIVVSHIIVGLEYFGAEHIGEEGLLSSKLLPAQLVRRNQVPVSVNPNVE